MLIGRPLWAGWLSQRIGGSVALMFQPSQPSRIVSQTSAKVERLDNSLKIEESFGIVSLS